MQLFKNCLKWLLFYTSDGALPELNSRFTEQLRTFVQTLTSFMAFFDAGPDSLLDSKTLTPLVLLAPTDDELHLACEMKIAKLLIQSKLSRSPSSAQSTFAKMDDTMSEL